MWCPLNVISAKVTAARRAGKQTSSVSPCHPTFRLGRQSPEPVRGDDDELDHCIDHLSVSIILIAAVCRAYPHCHHTICISLGAPVCCFLPSCRAPHSHEMLVSGSGAGTLRAISSFLSHFRRGYQSCLPCTGELLWQSCRTASSLSVIVLEEEAKGIDGTFNPFATTCDWSGQPVIGKDS